MAAPRAAIMSGVRALRQAVLPGLLMVTCANAFAQAAGFAVAGPDLPYGFHGGRPPAGLVAPPWGCAPGVRNCISQEDLRILLQRQRRHEGPGAEVPATGTWLVPQRRQLPPPTPESEVQPAYRESGSIRPEFRDSGAPLNPR